MAGWLAIFGILKLAMAIFGDSRLNGVFLKIIRMRGEISKTKIVIATSLKPAPFQKKRTTNIRKREIWTTFSFITDSYEGFIETVYTYHDCPWGHLDNSQSWTSNSSPNGTIPHNIVAEFDKLPPSVFWKGASSTRSMLKFIVFFIHLRQNMYHNCYRSVHTHPRILTSCFRNWK